VNVTMLNDQILVKIEPDSTTTAGGIQLPDNIKPARVGTFVFGTVVAAGKGRVDSTYPDNLKPMLVKEGDRVCFHDGSAKEVKVAREIYYLLSADSVNMIVPEGVDCSQVVYLNQAVR